MSEPAYPIVGPCEPWITGEDVAACCDAPCDPVTLFDNVAEEASLALYELSGRRWNGICTRVQRPCADRCGCWGMTAYNTPWFWTYSYATGLWGWWNECGDRCGCGNLETVPLPGYPIQQIVEVLIDGQVVDASSYRLDNRRSLVRMDDPGPPFQKRYWPACQNLSLEADQPGTFQVTYRWGMAPPAVARAAAGELACQLYLACSNNGGNCVLPVDVTKVTRLGVTIERSFLQHWLDPNQPTGLMNLDLFLRSYWGAKTERAAAVWSPDVKGYGLRVAP